MKKHFRVQSVLLSSKSAALTLTPVEWVRQVSSGPDPEDISYADCEPGDLDAEPYEPGGSRTELRIERHDADGYLVLQPDEFVTIDIKHTEHNWTP